MAKKEKNLAIALYNAVARYPERTALTEFVENKKPVNFSYRQLQASAKKIAGYLKENTSENSKIILAVSPGFDFLSHFLGCIYAGRIIAPCFEPKSSTTSERFENIVKTFCPELIIISSAIEKNPDNVANLTTVEKISNSKSVEFNPFEKTENVLNPTTIVQFTSGSTSEPKGVALQDINIISNVSAIIKHAEFIPEVQRTIVTWLPPYHDLGLFSHVLASIMISGHLVVLKPIDFIRNPLNWLEVLSNFKADYTTAPNTAFDMCVKRINSDKIKNLDLSNLQIIANAAEPIFAKTLHSFINLLKPCGLRAKSLMSAYGLAEATALVTASDLTSEIVITSFNEKRLKSSNQAILCSDSGNIELVSLGKPIPAITLTIRDHKTGKKLPEGYVGEVCLKGQTIALEYFNNKKKTEEAFKNDYLKTGDLGFLFREELYVIGRLKDLIIVNGQNYFPQDIEHMVIQYLEKDYAVIIQDFYTNQIILFFERPRKIKANYLEPLCEDISKSIFDKYDLKIDKVLVLKPGQIPITSSGKVQRQKTLDLFKAEKLALIYEYSPNLVLDELSKEEFVKIFYNFTKAKISQIDANTKISDLMLDSLSILNLELLLEQKFKLSLNLETIPETVDELYQSLVNDKQTNQVLCSPRKNFVEVEHAIKSELWSEISSKYDQFINMSGLLNDNPEHIITLAQKIALFSDEPASIIFSQAREILKNQTEKNWFWYLPNNQTKLRYWQKNLKLEYECLSKIICSIPKGSIIVMSHMHGWEWLLENIFMCADDLQQNLIFIADRREIGPLLQKSYKYHAISSIDDFENKILDVNDNQISVKLTQQINAGRTLVALPDTILAETKLQNNLKLKLLKGEISIAKGIFTVAIEKNLSLFHLQYRFERSTLHLKLTHLNKKPKGCSEIKMAKMFVSDIANNHLHWAQWALIGVDPVTLSRKRYGANPAKNANFFDKNEVFFVPAGELIYLCSLRNSRSIEMTKNDFLNLKRHKKRSLRTLALKYPMLSDFFNLELHNE